MLAVTFDGNDSCASFFFFLDIMLLYFLLVEVAKEFLFRLLYSMNFLRAKLISAQKVLFNLNHKTFNVLFNF